MNVRGGGALDSEGIFRFELTGGALCLDLANTLDERPTATPRELLADFPSLVSWAEQTGVITGEEATSLARWGRTRRREAGAALDGIRQLRELLFGIFSAVANGDVAPGRSLAELNGLLPAAFSRLRVRPSAGGFVLADLADAAAEKASPERIAAACVRSAADLLTSGELGRIRACASPTCAWLFLDRTKNRSRRWCDMAVCGNREKARAHYQRVRSRRPGRDPG